MTIGPSASFGASICPAFATTTALSQRPALIKAAARRKRIGAFAGCCAAWALRVGISVGVTDRGRGPPPPAQATTKPLMLRSRTLRPANVGDSRTRRGLKMPAPRTLARARGECVIYRCLTGTAMTRVTCAPLRGANGLIRKAARTAHLRRLGGHQTVGGAKRGRCRRLTLGFAASDASCAPGPRFA